MIGVGLFSLEEKVTEQAESPRVVMTRRALSPGLFRGVIVTNRQPILTTLVVIAITMVITSIILDTESRGQGGLQVVEPMADQVAPPQLAAQPEVVAPPQPAANVSPVNGLSRPDLSQVFPPSVQQWRDQIVDAAWEQGFDPNLLAIVVTVESCGNPNAISTAGARGLAQVMPYHFPAGADPFDPMTNLRAGATYFKAGLKSSNNNLGLTFAGYNGGHSRIQQSQYDYWPAETKKYYQLTMAIYSDVYNGLTVSPTVQGRCS